MRSNQRKLLIQRRRETDENPKCQKYKLDAEERGGDPEEVSRIPQSLPAL